MARENGIDTKKQVRKLKEGWLGKNKGILQILYERCWIKLEDLHRYKMDPVTDETGNIIDNTFSLKTIMSNQSDFLNETTLLQHNLQEIGQLRGINIMVLRSPKCHPEVAGEGVEYYIAHAKIYI